MVNLEEDLRERDAEHAKLERLERRVAELEAVAHATASPEEVIPSLAPAVSDDPVESASVAHGGNAWATRQREKYLDGEGRRRDLGRGGAFMRSCLIYGLLAVCGVTVLSLPGVLLACVPPMIPQLGELTAPILCPTPYSYSYVEVYVAYGSPSNRSWVLHCVKSGGGGHCRA